MCLAFLVKRFSFRVLKRQRLYLKVVSWKSSQKTIIILEEIIKQRDKTECNSPKRGVSSTNGKRDSWPSCRIDIQESGTVNLPSLSFFFLKRQLTAKKQFFFEKAYHHLSFRKICGNDVQIRQRSIVLTMKSRSGN